MRTKNKQLLILQDLGVNQEFIQSQLNYYNIIHEIVYLTDTNKIDYQSVEIILTIKHKIDTHFLKQFANVKLVAVAFTGYDAVDVNYCKSTHIMVANVPSYATHSVAELTVGLAISLLRQIPTSQNLIYQNGWDFAPGFDLNRKKIGIVGTGAIGIAVTKLFSAFGCTVNGWSKSINPAFENAGGTYVTSIDNLCSMVDILSLHIPLNELTKNLISKNQFALMKKTTFLINTARGPLINEDALINALENNGIAGAALDVFNTEPLPTDSRLLTTKNLLLTPHIAYKTHESLKKRAMITFENIARFLEGNPINIVTK